MSDYVVRGYRLEDENFVVESWLSSYAKSNDVRQFETDSSGPKLWDSYDRLWTEHRPVVMSLILEAEMRVVADDNDPNIIYAWACVSPNVLHYAIVKRDVVDRGFGREMLDMLLGEELKGPMRLSHEPAWTRHSSQSRRAYEARYPEWMKLVEEERRRSKNPRARGPKPPTLVANDHGVPLPYYHQESESWMPLPRAWKVDRNALAQTWCPVRRSAA